jgi:PPK2 family polyphosphate:nucleotide phosphotransferase
MHAYSASTHPVHHIANFSLATQPTRQARGPDSSRQPKPADLRESTVVLRQLLVQIEKNQSSSLLLILQGMDASGKDSSIRMILKSLESLKIRTEAFRQPDSEELQHDFLWRIHQKVPRLGELVIFNRSHYEDVLVARVRGGIDRKTLEKRFQHILNFESLLIDHQVIVVKCFLHITKDEQQVRLQSRMDDPTKHGKLDLSDLEDRAHWDDYMKAYEEALVKTSTHQAPWYIVPSDHKLERDLNLQNILIHCLRN